MARQVIESLAGIGDIVAGGQVLRRTTYHLEVSSEVGSRGGVPPESVMVEGSIDIVGMGEALVLAGPQDLTLQLEDGRRLAFSLTSTSGRIQAHGALQR